ncbi:PREDICTED: uncharacterized protein LOC109216211 [Nicotiana attenuata]|uniref:uncharacterized protein LOC109216211 n=1 Tax=Nicotiana attenuata TaxID=49451 RepID=UPI0009048615|nr:PREDICTED: uncharacterized protein LOC109216211 [Nicotiana attenuata]
MGTRIPDEQGASSGSLGRIASCLGKPICTDKLTANGERVSYARILIEMDVSLALPEEIPIELPGGKYRLQTIEYEWRLLYCQSCLSIGHRNGEGMKATQTDKEKQQLHKKKQKMDWRVEPVVTKEVGTLAATQDAITQSEDMEYQVHQAKSRGKKKLAIIPEQEGQRDFNTILSVDDRQNGVPVQPAEVKDFQECIEDIGLGQLKRTGCQFS